jgi:hypothetical protein
MSTQESAMPSSFPLAALSRRVFALVSALVIGALVSIGFSTPAFATTTPTLSVYLTSTSGMPLSGVDLTLLPLAGTLIDEFGDEVTGTETTPGTYTFAASAHPIAVDGTYILEFTNTANSYTQFYGNSVSAYGATPLYFPSGAVRTIDASIDTNVTISGKVTTSTGSALKDVYVIPYRWDGAQWQQRSDFTDATSSSGAYKLTDLDPGSYRLFFLDNTTRGYLPTYSGGAATLDSATPFYVGLGGAVTYNQKLSKGGTIAGKLTYKYGSHTYGNDHMVAVAYTLTPDGSGGFSGVDKAAGYFFGDSTSTSGKWSIPGVPSGTYVVKFYNDGYYVDDDRMEEVYVGDSSSNSYRAYTWNTAHRFVVAQGKTTTRTQITNLDFESDVPAASIQYHVQNSGASAVNGATVTVTSSDNEDFWFSAATNSSGNVVVPRIPAGDYTLLVTAPGSPATYQPWMENFTFNGVATTKTVTLGSDTSLGVSYADVTPDPTVPANLVVGTTYTVDAGATQTGATLTYQWLRDGQPIFGAVSSTYTSSSGDVGHYLTCIVSVSKVSLASNQAGAAVGTITAGAQITSTGGVAISPDTDVAFGSTVTAKSGTWSVAGSLIQYQWYSDGDGSQSTWDPIVGATASTYAPASADVGANIRVAVSASKVGYTTSDDVVVGPVHVVSALAPAVVKKPTITKSTSGVPSGYTKYTVSNGTWNVSGLSYSYAWSIGSSSGDLANVQVVPNDGSRVRVQVVATKPGLAQGSYIGIARKGTGGPEQGVTTPVIYQLDPSVEITSADQEVQPGAVLYFYTHPSWTFPDGETGGERSWQWYRQVGSGSVKAISKATHDTYVTTTSDIGAKISVVETASMASDYTLKASTAQLAAGAVVANSDLVDDPATVTVSGTGDRSIGSTLTATVSAWGSTSGVTNTYSWRVCDPGVLDCSDLDNFSLISSAKSKTLTITSFYQGKRILAVVRGTKKYFTSVTAYATPVQVSSDADEFQSTGAPAISAGLDQHGIALVGHKLTASASGYDTSGVTKTFLWQTCDADVSDCAGDVGWTDASSESSLTSYTPVPADVLSGADYIRVLQIGHHGSAVVVAASPQYVLAPGVPTNSVLPKITTTSSSFTVSAGTWSPAGTIHYQWYIDEVPSGGDSAVFDRSLAPAGAAVYVRVLNDGPAGYGSTSVFVVAVKGAAPTIVPGVLTIDGDAYGAGALELTGSSPFTYPAGSDPRDTLTYQWYAGSSAISGAKGETFTPSTSYIGKSLKVKVTSTSPRYGTAYYYTPSVTLMLGTIPGTAEFDASSSSGIYPGTVLTADTSSFTLSGLTKSYAWQLQPIGGGTWTSISGATKTTYIVKASDVDSNIRLLVTVKKKGYATLSSPSTDSPVEYLPQIGVTTAPVISGAGVVGKLLTLSTGVFDVAGVSVTQQWYRDGAILPGVTGTTYTPLSSSLNDDITATVTVRKAGYPDLVVGSNAVTVGLGDAPVPSATPAITGLPFAGGTLGVNTVGSPPAVRWNLSGLTFQYQWYRADNDSSPTSAISGATSHSYTIPGGEPDGVQYHVFVTVYKEGHASYYYQTSDVTVASSF